MKDKLLQIRVDEDFLSKLEYLKKVNNYKNNAETIRKVIEKEFRIDAIMRASEIQTQMVVKDYLESVSTEVTL